MVGAGFSRNAQKITPNVPLPPLLGHLAGVMFEALYPVGHWSEKDREYMKVRMTSGGAILRLASEYEIVFGRMALDELILQSIPDSSYNPGPLHRLLLSLPWSDVFTTNYDTLLERTRPAIHGRKYDLVQVAADIPGRMKPRIVKLHGSFPSHRPFIITDEDYRTYPSQFPPFVNMVQQSIMENAFCLVGFSGEDPNFLYWSGWVRDHLKEAAAPIYLCGILNLTPSQRRLLERRNVIPVDLTPVLADVDVRDEQTRQELALEWFLRSLQAGEPTNKMSWPDVVNRPVWVPGYDLPPIRQNIPPGVDTRDPEPSAGEQRIEIPVARNLIESWASRREQYPGWVVLPFENRHSLWRQTDHWLSVILESLSQLPPPENIYLLYELNWRLERTLTPIDTDWLPAFEAVVTTFNPFPRTVQSAEACITPDSADYVVMDWRRIGDQWVELVFALARKAREDQNEHVFRRWIDLLRSVVRTRSQWQARWYYEQALYYFFGLDREGMLRVLNEWPAQDLSFWEGKRAALLAELGEISEAQRIAEAVLNDVRSRSQPYVVDHSLLSQEGWMMLLLFTIALEGMSRNRDQEDFIQGQFRFRWAELKSYGCDPWEEVNALRAEVRTLEGETHPDSEVISEFDPGQVTVRHHYARDPLFIRRRPAFAFLRLFEEGALPMRGMASKHGFAAARLIAPFAPLWALSMMVRSDDDESLSKWFDRVRVAKLSNEDVTRLNALLSAALVQAVGHLSENPQEVRSMSSFYAHHLEIIADLLSRLSFRLPPADLDALLRRAVELYRAPLFRTQPYFYKTLAPLFERVIYAMPNVDLLSRFDLLLSLPIPSEQGFEVSSDDRIPEPMEAVEFTDEFRISDDFDRSLWAAPVARLITLLHHGAPPARKRAALRIVILADIGGLSANELAQFREALWSQLDERGLPANTNFYKSVFLKYPRPGADTTKADVKQYMLSEDFVQSRVYFREISYATVRVGSDEEKRRTFIDWTQEDAVLLLNRAIEWWNGVETMISVNRERRRWRDSHELSVKVYDLMKFLAVVVLPRLNTASDELKAEAVALIFRVESAGFSIYSALPNILYVAPARYDLIMQKMREGLNSVKADESRDAIIGTYFWLLHSSLGDFPAPPDDFFNELINKVAFRRQPSLESAIAQTAVVVKELPQLITPQVVESLTTGLQYLLAETELPDEFEREAIPNSGSTIPIQERPALRAASAGLARRLFVFMTEAGREIPDVIVRWRDVALNDRLPEVRRAWIQA
jgi:hypothetical protein